MGDVLSLDTLVVVLFSCPDMHVVSWPLRRICNLDTFFLTAQGVEQPREGYEFVFSNQRLSRAAFQLFTVDATVGGEGEVF